MHIKKYTTEEIKNQENIVEQNKERYINLFNDLNSARYDSDEAQGNMVSDHYSIETGEKWSHLMDLERVLERQTTNAKSKYDESRRRLEHMRSNVVKMKEPVICQDCGDPHMYGGKGGHCTTCGSTNLK